MTTALWIAACFGSATFGALIMAFFAGSRIANEMMDRMDASDEADEARNNEAAANRIALEKCDRIERALEQITPGANATVKRIARILKGEA